MYQQDEVIVSPYNGLLALDAMLSYSDVILPMQNDSLIRIAERSMKDADQLKKGDGPGAISVASLPQSAQQEKLPFGGMNDIAARLITDLTSSMRFGGSLNMDLNEIETNFIPLPKLFNEVFSKEHQLMDVDIIRYKFLNCGLFALVQ
ncbi:MAG: putative tubulin epsilon chain [Streblomastix strix]|uniref:Putative tubulin epsilon chain n=1 Tax=Streblomastix strix TaxID=222440 RepID=A0A5J4TUE4_9EUKA|nr:MAG: putative tubulin epsilon chain [Streblomastix strix]